MSKGQEQEIEDQQEIEYQQEIEQETDEIDNNIENVESIKKPEFKFTLDSDDERDLYACRCGRRAECIECGVTFCRSGKGFQYCFNNHNVGICAKCYNRGIRWEKCKCIDRWN